MGSPYKKIISAKFYVETWVGRLDILFDKKDIFLAFFRHKSFFFTRTGTGTGPGREGHHPPGIWPRTTPRVDLPRAQGRRAASKRSNILSKTLFFTKKKPLLPEYHPKWVRPSTPSHRASGHPWALSGAPSGQRRGPGSSLGVSPGTPQG